MTLLRAASLSLSFGSRTVFRDLELVIEEGERVGLIGVNGSGKSSLMKILAGAMAPDSGELQLRRGAAVTYLAQEPEFPPGATVEAELSAARPALRDALVAHNELSRKLERAPAGERELAQLAELSHRIDQLGGWDTSHEARTLLDPLRVKGRGRPPPELSRGTRPAAPVGRGAVPN